MLIVYAPNALFKSIPIEDLPGATLGPVVIFAPLNDTLLSRTYTPTESCPVVIFPDITEVPLAATPTASAEFDVSTVKSILAFSPNTPTPPEAIFKVPVVILFAPVFLRYIPTLFELIVPPVPAKVFAVPSTYTPVPVVVVIVPVFLPELVPNPPIYIPRLAPADIVPLFSTAAVFPA